MYVVFDSCVVDLLATLGINPANDFRDTEFVIAYTPDLKEEYKRAASKEGLSAAIRTLHLGILDAGTLLRFFGFDGEGCLGLDEGSWAHSSQITAIKAKK